MRVQIKGKILILSAVLLSILISVLLFMHHTVVEHSVAISAGKLNLGELLTHFKMQSIVIGLIISFVVLVIVFVVTSTFTRNISTINESLKFLEQGMLPEKLLISSNDEIGDISNRINSITESLKYTAQYSEEVGRGNFSQDFKPLSDDDLLRNSLLGMTKSLREADDREKERTWVINGIAEIGDILRENQSLELLGESIIKFLVDRIGAVQGAFYVASTDDVGKSIIELKYAYAYNRKKYMNQAF